MVFPQWRLLGAIELGILKVYYTAPFLEVLEMHADAP
jgi:hypothetical protein